MKNLTFSPHIENLIHYDELIEISNDANLNFAFGNGISYFRNKNRQTLSEVLFITSYPPSECGIATYTQDLMNAIKDKFGKSFSLKVCALQGKDLELDYPNEVKYVLNTNKLEQYDLLAQSINTDANLDIVFIQHEFGLYGGNYGDYLLQLLAEINKTVITAFHTVLPNPNKELLAVVQAISTLSNGLVVMTQNSANILINEYDISAEKIMVIAHGTHLVASIDCRDKNAKNHLGNRLVLSTFGLLSSGKSIETALDALPAIIAEFPNVLYLVIGKTHPGVVKHEGEKYRDFLHEKVVTLNLQDNVKFINKYVSLDELLEYLQRTDIYLFTSKDPNQAVSGTLAYAFASGCPVVSTPIPHANEMLIEPELMFDFGNSFQLANAVKILLRDEKLRKEIGNRGLQNTAAYAFENSAITHAKLFEKMSHVKKTLKYTMPEINLSHLKKMTTDIGMIQFSQFDSPDLESGYTVDDNARALIALCQHYELTLDKADLPYIKTYLDFIKFCQQSEGYFLNYVDENRNFTSQNNETNIADSNGRAIWSIGYVISLDYLLPAELVIEAEEILEKALPHLEAMYSTRSMAFVIKGLAYANQQRNYPKVSILIKTLANRMVQMYKHESEQDWHWFESYLTYANSILPEALLCAYQDSGSNEYMKIARESFDFLLSVIFHDDHIKVVSNRGWHIKGKESNQFGEQAIDVAYTILALSRFYDIFKDATYLEKMENAFDWFLGKNHLNQIVYNPCTGGCYDGLEENYINLNQGAESTVSYLMSRLTLESYEKPQKPLAIAENTVEEMEFELVQS
jgi:glycosyltransferase involved in cell wall biosynthesis